MISYSAATTAKCEDPIAQSHDIYAEEIESIAARTRIDSKRTLAVVIAMLAKEYPTLVA
jgi:hypothetical protein|tara:strand:+ start:404 stop:580 length:177 start_codon:yes stop_codon:yes gene_type:complete